MMQTRESVQDLVRVHAKLFAFLYSARRGRCDAEAHAFAEQHWRRFRGKAIDFLAVSIAAAERDAAAPWN